MTSFPVPYGSIVVLYRRDDSLALYGIPYAMRADVGQQPRDIKEQWRQGWIYLGVPGAESPDTLAWLATLACVPEGPHEWCYTEALTHT